MLMDTKYLPLLEEAGAGNQRALHELSCMYLLGEGVPKDLLKAREYLELMVNSQNKDIYEFEYGALYSSVGDLYYLKSNFTKANSYYTKAYEFILDTYDEDYAQELCDKLELKLRMEESNTK